MLRRNDTLNATFIISLRCARSYTCTVKILLRAMLWKCKDPDREFN